jgi:hypothetical protein
MFRMKSRSASSAPTPGAAIISKDKNAMCPHRISFRGVEVAKTLHGNAANMPARMKKNDNFRKNGIRLLLKARKKTV